MLAFYTELGLLGSLGVVDSCVDHLAVSAANFRTERPMLLDDKYFMARTGKYPRASQANNAGTYHNSVYRFRHLFFIMKWSHEFC
jgi:hypothetical protein